jgi:hypothetical protein
MEKSEPQMGTADHPGGIFTKVLADVLSATPKQIQDSSDAAKRERFSSHTRLKYVPANPS